MQAVVVGDFVARRSRNEQKRRAFESLLNEDVTVRIHVRPTIATLPTRVKQKPAIVLDFKDTEEETTYKDLVVTASGIEAKLWFGGLDYNAHIPWSSVYAIETLDDPRWSVWDEDAPEECNI